MTNPHSHYFHDVRHLGTVDIYRLIELLNITHPALQHAFKKVAAAGKRGAKDEAKDVQEAIDSLVRWQEMRAEDQSLTVQVPAGWPIRGWLTETYGGEEMLWPTKKEADLHTDEDRPAIALYAPPIIAIEPEVKE